MIKKIHGDRFVRILIPACLLLSLILTGCAPAASEPELDFSRFSFSGVVEQVMSSVVFIYVEREVFGQTRGGSGSGVILRPDGYILTNRHVVEGADRVEVTLQDRSVYEATDVWMDDILDLAVVKIDVNNLKTARFGNPEDIRVGDWAIALGHPLGLSPDEGGATVTVGVISNLGRSLIIGNTPYYDVVQMDTAINPGNSGGPLVNASGEVIGINSAGNVQAQNINFAINVRTARRVFEDLVAYGKVQRPYLGANLNDITPDVACELCLAERIGSLITRIDPDGPAALTGLQEGDVVVRIDDEKIVSTVTLINTLWARRTGDKVDITFFRGDEEMQVTVTLTEKPGDTIYYVGLVAPVSVGNSN